MAERVMEGALRNHTAMRKL
uniref:Uncharacterized protein n=1 Tax=Arundo donax TaxID=35708 RepID=A0A0A8ZRM0_ARUDO